MRPASPSDLDWMAWTRSRSWPWMAKRTSSDEARATLDVFRALGEARLEVVYRRGEVARVGRDAADPRFETRREIEGPDSAIDNVAKTLSVGLGNEPLVQLARRSNEKIARPADLVGPPAHVFPRREPRLGVLTDRVPRVIAGHRGVLLVRGLDTVDRLGDFA